MKKQTVVIIWAAALLLLVVSCFGIFYFYNEPDSIGKTNKNIEVFGCTPESIVKYSVSDKNGEYSIKKISNDWCTDDNNVTNLNIEKINQLIYSASNIKAVGTISKRKLAEFDTSDAKKLEIDIENETDTENIEIRFLGTRQGFCAFKVEDAPQIYIMYQSTCDILTPSLNSLRVSEVFKELAQKDSFPEYFSYIDYDRTGFEVRTKTADELAKSKKNRYIMEKPYKREVDDELFEQQIAVKIPMLQATAFIKEPESLEGLGLDENSRAEFTFIWDGISETLYLGKNNGGLIYAKKKGTDGIFTINSLGLEFLNIDPFYILENSVFKINTDGIQSVIVKAQGEDYNITVADLNTEAPRFYVNGKAASENVFNEVLNKLDNVNFIGELITIPPNTADIVVTINCNNTAESQTISLAKQSDKNYAAFIDGKAEFSVNGEAVAELLEKLKEASNNPMKVE